MSILILVDVFDSVGVAGAKIIRAVKKNASTNVPRAGFPRTTTFFTRTSTCIPHVFF